MADEIPTVADGAVEERFVETVEGLPTDPEHLEARRRRGLGLTAWLALAWLFVVAVMAIVGPYLPLPEREVSCAREGPAAGHLLGCDQRGNDNLTLVVEGTRPTIALAVAVIAGALLIGGAAGLVAGYFRGKTDTALTNVLNIMLALPQLVLAMAIVKFMGQTFWNVVLALVIVATPLLGRITRANTLTFSEREFVLAAKTLGAKHGRVMVREVLPNVLPAMFSIALLAIAIVIVAEGGLAILNVGLTETSWGTLIAENRGQLSRNPWPVIVPVTVIFFTVLAFNYLGDVVREHFDVRESAL